MSPSVRRLRLPNDVVGVSLLSQLSVDQQQYESYDSTQGVSVSKLAEMFMVPNRVCVAHLMRQKQRHANLTVM